MNSKVPEWLEIGGARRSDPDTSHEAAESVDATAIQLEVHKVMMPYGLDGCISDDVVRLLPHHREHTVTPRFAPMIELGMIELTGEKRKGISGRLQLVRRALPPPWVPKAPPDPEAYRLDLYAKLATLEAEIERVEKAWFKANGWEWKK